MASTDRYEPAGQDIVSEEIEGEVVIVNLGNGNYYSLTQSASLIWAGIQNGVTVEQIRDWLRGRYSGELETMDKDLERLIEALEKEGLIGRVTSGPAAAGDAPAAPAGEREAYLPPLFERFTDMGDLLLLDPVHDAEEEKGWPHAKVGG